MKIEYFINQLLEKINRAELDFNLNNVKKNKLKKES